MDKGANLKIMSEENGYGSPSDKPFSKGEATYTSSPAKPVIVNENFTEPKYAGGTPPTQPSASKDSIKGTEKVSF